MSDSEEEPVEIIPMPKHRIRFSDMPNNLIEKAVRSKDHKPLLISILLVCDAADKKFTLDKEVASEIQKLIHADPELGDECAGWHVIVGKSFASAISYNTKFLCFLDLMEGCPKTFLLFKTV